MIKVKDGHGKGKMQVTEDEKPVFRAQYAFQKVGPLDDQEFEKSLAEYEQSMKMLKSNKLTFVPYTTREALPHSRGNKEVWIVFQNDLKKAVKYWYVEGEKISCMAKCSLVSAGRSRLLPVMSG